MSEEFYCRPLFRVRDVKASLDYYREKLGFTEAWKHGDPSPIIAQVNRNGLDIILDSSSVIPKAAIPSALSLSPHLPQSLGALYDELKGRGARIVSPPAEVPWEKGLYQLHVEDLDGNRLIFWGSWPTKA